MRINTDRFGLCLTLVSLAFLSGPAAANDHPAPETQLQIFERLQSLEGRYLENDASEKAAKVEYQLWSRDSALVEVWEMPTKREFTVFHMDNDKLVATHYCGGKFQVTMDLVWPVTNDTYEFKARYVSNHSSPDAAYNSGFSYRFSDSETVWRQEIWTTAGEDSVSDLTMGRQEEG